MQMGLHEQFDYRWNPVHGLTAQTINKSVRMQKAHSSLRQQDLG